MNNEKKPPEELYLLMFDEDGKRLDPQENEGWLWCEDNVHGNGVKYTRTEKILDLIAKIESEEVATGEPSESVQLGRLQVCDELRAIVEVTVVGEVKLDHIEIDPDEETR